MRDAVRNKEWWRGRRTPTQDPSTEPRVRAWHREDSSEIDDLLQMEEGATEGQFEARRAFSSHPLSLL